MLRPLYKADVPQVLVIEHEAHVVPWTEDTFKSCIQAGYLGWVIEVDKKIVGFIVMSISLEECHILNLCVMHKFQHQGHGRALLENALTYARTRGVTIAYLEVRRSNSRAIALYQKLQFQQIGERKDYYPTIAGHEDALIFAKSLRLEIT